MQDNENTSEFILVRTGKGTCVGDSFSDIVVETVRTPRRHRGWRSVKYLGKRYQLNGGIRNAQFICLNNPIKSR